MRAARWLILLALTAGACSAPSYQEVQAELPAPALGTGRVVFLGDNYGWYGLLEGVSWKPVLAVDGDVLDVGHGNGIYFVADLPVGNRRVSVDGVDYLTVFVEPKATKYVEMLRLEEENEGFSLRKANFRMKLTRLDEAHAQARLASLEYIGVAE